VTDSLKGAFGLAGADVGVGLRPKNIGAGSNASKIGGY